MADPVILELAINGQTPKATNPNVPRTSEEIVADAIRCIDAGAAVVHTHIEEITSPAERAAELYLEHMVPIREARGDAHLYPTLGFGETVADRLRHVELLCQRFPLEIGFVDPGSVNLGGVDAAGRPIPMDFAYANTPADIRYGFDLCEKLGLAPSIAIFEPGFLRHALAYHRSGHLPRGSHLKFYLGGEYGYMGAGHAGLGFGLPGESWALDVYLRLLGDCGLPWSVGVLGGDVFAGGVARHALERRGHLHVGLEDYMGEAKPTNLEIVQQAARLCAEVGRPIATPKDAARILRLGR